MLSFALPLATGMFALALLLNAWRLLRGPGMPDRILALDTLYVNSLALLILIGIRQDSTAYFEAALLISLLGFVSTVVLARFLARGDILR
ncbi:MAG: K+/H+ antiporter subunit F [Quisquiliibacterium sp.]|jgi:multicomponent K+:H+ antiporter subunit F